MRWQENLSMKVTTKKTKGPCDWGGGDIARGGGGQEGCARVSGNRGSWGRAHTMPGAVDNIKTGRKKRKDEESITKFKYNKRGKLKDDKIKELARTNLNIFSWLKPSPPPMIKVAEVMEVECQDEVENMDVGDAMREERLERVRVRQLLHLQGDTSTY